MRRAPTNLSGGAVFALLALLLFLFSPFFHAAGPWPLVTLGLASLALHLLLGTPLPWRRG